VDGVANQSASEIPAGEKAIPFSLVLRYKHKSWRRQGLNGIRVPWVPAQAVNGYRDFTPAGKGEAGFFEVP
jgi:hypothetical protein